MVWEVVACTQFGIITSAWLYDTLFELILDDVVILTGVASLDSDVGDAVDSAIS